MVPKANPFSQNFIGAQRAIDENLVSSPEQKDQWFDRCSEDTRFEFHTAAMADWAIEYDAMKVGKSRRLEFLLQTFLHTNAHDAATLSAMHKNRRDEFLVTLRAEYAKKTWPCAMPGIGRPVVPVEKTRPPSFVKPDAATGTTTEVDEEMPDPDSQMFEGLTG